MPTIDIKLSATGSTKPLENAADAVESLDTAARKATPSVTSFSTSVSSLGTAAQKANAGIAAVPSVITETATKAAVATRSIANVAGALNILKGAYAGVVSAAEPLANIMDFSAGRMMGDMLNYGAMGAAVGSIIPGVGTAAGAVAGTGIGVVKTTLSEMKSIGDINSAAAKGYADLALQGASPETLRSLDQFDAKTKEIAATLRSLQNMRENVGWFAKLTGGSGDMDKQIAKLERAQTQLDAISTRERNAIINRNYRADVSSAQDAANPSITKIDALLTAWQDAKAATLSAQKEVVQRNTTHFSSRFGLDAGTTAADLQQALSSRIGELEADLATGDLGKVTAARDALRDIAESGALDAAAKIAAVAAQIADREAANTAATRRAENELEVAKLDRQKAAGQISNEDYASRRLAIFDRDAEEDAKLDTEDTRAANAARREKARMALEDSLTGGKKAPGDATRVTLGASQLSDSITSIGGSIGANYAGINAQWQQTLAQNTQQQVALLAKATGYLSTIATARPSAAIAG